MKVERTQLPLASASKQISQFAASRRVDPAPGLNPDEARKHRKQKTDEEEDEQTPAGNAQAKGSAERMLNITA